MNSISISHAIKTTVANGSTTFGVSSTLEVQGHDLLHPARPHMLIHFFASQSQYSMPKCDCIKSQLIVYIQRFVSFLYYFLCHYYFNVKKKQIRRYSNMPTGAPPCHHHLFRAP